MKQAILVRMDLKLPKGKMAGQCAHAAVESVYNSRKSKVAMWRAQGAKKVVLKVADKKELLMYRRKAEKEGLVAALIIDAGKTFFKKPTATCLGIGPDADSKIDKIVGHLKLV